MSADYYLRCTKNAASFRILAMINIADGMMLVEGGRLGIFDLTGYALTSSKPRRCLVRDAGHSVWG
jgi:hypothetical protein